MRKIRRPIAVFLSILMMFGTFSFAVYADENREIICESLKPESHLSPQGLEVEDFYRSVDFEALRSYLIEKFASCPAGGVDISQFAISVDYVNDLLDAIWNNIPELFHIRDTFRYSYKKSTNILTKIIPVTYFYSASEYAERLKMCEDAADKLLYGIEDNSALTDYEKALLLHDRIAAYCEYAKAELNAGTLAKRQSAYRMDGVFIDRSAVCNGYAVAFNYLARRVGLTSYYCGSDEIDHGWNIVYVNGIPYHLDATWDDPSWDNAGRVKHDSVLLSTDTFKAQPSNHNASDYDTTPCDTAYDDVFWRNDVLSSIIYLGGTYYYLYGAEHDNCTLRSTPAKTLLDQSDDTILLDVNFDWMMSDNSSWTKTFSRLSTDGHDLYFNGNTKVYKYNLKTNELSDFYIPELDTDNYEYIYGSYYDGRYLTMDIANTPKYGSADYDGRITVEILNSNCALGSHLAKMTADCVEATCKNEGYSAEYTCMVCGEKVPPAVTPKLPHTYGNWYTVVASTCKDEGVTERICSFCHEAERKTIPVSSDHIWTWITDAEPNCINQGVMHEECSNCGAVRSENTLIPKTGIHIYGEPEMVSEPTCTSEGIEITVCTVCGDTIEKIAERIGHSDADCDDICDICGGEYDAFADCDCVCHYKTGIIGIIYKMICIIWKIFGIEHICDCEKQEF